jgi:uncharacterized protein (TIGR02647 family)
MPLSPDQVEEIDILSLFDLSSHQQGIKVHSHIASGTDIAATKRLFEKGLVSKSDGGYLTTVGQHAAEHAQALATILKGNK